MSSAFCALSVSVDDLKVDLRDYHIDAKIIDGKYVAGSVWVCSGKIGDAFGDSHLYYLPESSEPHEHCEGKVPCYVERLSAGMICVQHDIDALFSVLNPHYGGSLKEDRFNKYSGPHEDMICAIVTGIKDTMTNCRSYNGVLHPQFNSWARYCPDVIFREKILMTYDNHVRGVRCKGSVWISHWHDKNMLFYRSDFGPHWMCYCYDLECNAGWPKNWLPELKTIQSLVVAKKDLREVERDAEANRIVSIIKATLSGRAARWDEDVWFVWRPQCQEDDPVLQVQPTDFLQKGSVYKGVYAKGSMWWVPLPEDHFACRIRSYGGEVFQIKQDYSPEDTDDRLAYGAPGSKECFDTVRAFIKGF